MQIAETWYVLDKQQVNHNEQQTQQTLNVLEASRCVHFEKEVVFAQFLGVY